MKAWLVSFLDNICKLTWMKRRKKSIKFFQWTSYYFTDVIRLVLCVLLFKQCQGISGSTTTDITEIVPSWSNNITCPDDFNNTNHKIDYVHGDVVISVITIDPLPSQYVLKRVSDLIDSKVSLGMFHHWNYYFLNIKF